MTHLIIDRPELQPRGQRLLFGLLTVALWTFYAYLLLPVATLLAWWLGYAALYEAMIAKHGWEMLLELLGLYLGIIGVIGLAQILWAVGNWLRFSGKRERRRERAYPVHSEFIQPLFLTDTSEFPAWQDSKRLTVHLHPTLPRIISVVPG
jgi:poly-beta-1,6-N-acetyl-D-glucosamine biosynthesis protein PgaD